MRALLSFLLGKTAAMIIKNVSLILFDSITCDFEMKVNWKDHGSYLDNFSSCKGNPKNPGLNWMCDCAAFALSIYY